MTEKLIFYTLLIFIGMHSAFAQQEVSKEMFVEYFPYDPNWTEILNKDSEHLMEPISYPYAQSDTPQVKLRIADTYITQYPARSYVIYSFDFLDGDGDIVSNAKNALVNVLLQGANFKMTGGVGGPFLNWPGVTSGGVCHSISVDGIVRGSCLFSIFLKDAAGHESNRDSTIVVFDATRSNPTIRVSVNELDFGNVALDSSSQKTFTIFNDGGRDLSVHLFTNDLKFSVVSNHFFVISPDSSQNVTIRFSPDSIDQQTATLHLSCNDPAKHCYCDFHKCVQIALSGMGIPIYNKPPDIISPTSVIAYEDSLFEYTARANDPEDSVITYIFKNYPSWLVPNDSTISGEYHLTIRRILPLLLLPLMVN